MNLTLKSFLGGQGTRDAARPNRFAWAAVVLAGLGLCCGAPVRAEPFVAADARATPGVHRGELLFGELNCVACHSTSQAAVDRLASKKPPVLHDAGARLTPQFLRAFLLDPQIEKPGTTMPDVLAGRSPPERAATAESLVHYLMSQGTARADAAVAADPYKVAQGKRLYHTVGCVACHEPFERPGGSSEVGPEARALSVPLGNLARKLTAPELARFLLDPLKIRPSGRMPGLNLTAGEATAIAIYLLRAQAPGVDQPLQLDRLAGLKFQYFEIEREMPATPGDPSILSDFLDHYPGNVAAARGRIRLVKSGETDRFNLGLRDRNDFFGFMFTGYLRVQARGEYTFFTASDDGSRLYIDDQLVVNNDGEHGGTERFGRITLDPGEHAIRVTYYEAAGGEELAVHWQGPGLSKTPIPPGALSHRGKAMKPIDAIEFAVDAEKARAGRLNFQQLGCANCHGPMPGDAPPSILPRSKALADLQATDAGCLADRPSGNAVDYRLGAAQRSALRELADLRSRLDSPMPENDRVLHSLARLDCLACHTRQGVGGPAESRREWFTTVGDADLGDEGRIPPPLTGVGGKLRQDWLNELLGTAPKVRPYMATRMPVFGTAQVQALPALFARVDGGTAPEPPPAPSGIDDAKFGRKLAGATGLSCIACHTFGEFKSLGIPAMDLTLMSRRLRQAWFQRYLVNPIALRPGTRMPSFWPEGRAVNTEVLGGDTARQIEALWAFLSQGPLASPPDGLVQGKMELTVGSEPVIYRHFIQGAGPRAIGVGYPERANLAWDAQQLRLAKVWHGAFIDVARHRTGRGEGFEGPLGHDVVSFSDGPPLALLPDATQPWPTPTGTAAGYRMRGYELDDLRRPKFLFEFQGVRVTDHPVPVPGTLDPGFRRTLRFSAATPPANLWFRAAVADSIETQGDGWLIDRKIKLRIRTTGLPVVRPSANGKSELLVPVRFADGRGEIVEEIQW